MAFFYACADREEMKACPGTFVAEKKEEVCRLTDFHAKPAHAEDFGGWDDETRACLKSLIRTI